MSLAGVVRGLHGQSSSWGLLEQSSTLLSRFIEKQLKNISSTLNCVANYLQNEEKVTAIPALFFLKYCFFEWLSLPVTPVAKTGQSCFWTHESTFQQGVPSPIDMRLPCHPVPALSCQSVC